MCLDGEVDHGDAPIPIPIIRPQLSLWSRDRDSLQAQGRAEVANVAKLQASSEVWNGEPTCGTRVFATQHSGEMTRSIGTT